MLKPQSIHKCICLISCGYHLIVDKPTWDNLLSPTEINDQIHREINEVALPCLVNISNYSLFIKDIEIILRKKSINNKRL
jgi:hypothetical protein